MKTVMAQGVFDILHPGHLHYLQKSRELGDELVVVIARDSRIEKDTEFNEKERLEMVEALETVNNAVLGSEEDIYSTVQKINPDVITIGYDQSHEESDVKKMAETATGHSVEVKRISGYKKYSSSKIRD